MFHKLFPNLKSFDCPQPRLYYNGNNLDDSDCLWNIFKRPYYYDKLEHVEIDMLMRYYGKYNWNFDPNSTKHINITNHPLTHFGKFKKLKSL